MSVQTQIDRISRAVSAALAAIADKGVTVPDGSNSDSLAALIAAIEAGGGGGAQCSVGTITPAEDTTELTWNHGLSKPPMFAALWMRKGYTGNTYSNLLRIYYFTHTKYYGDQGEWDAYITGSRNITITHANSESGDDEPWIITDTTITAGRCKFGDNTTNNFVAGKPYNWICVASDNIFPK